MHFGDRLCDVLGDKETIEFLRFAFQAATEGLLSGQSHTLIHDRIRVALATHFSNEERQLLRLASEHAGLIFESPASCGTACRPSRKVPPNAPGGHANSSMMPTNWS